MKLTSSIVVAVALAYTSLGAPLIKTAIIALGGEELLATAAYDVASVGASFAVEHTGLFGPLLNYIPGAQIILGAAGLLGGRFAGGTAGGVASKATLGLIEGSLGNDLPLVGWIIRDGKLERVSDVSQ
ncbi:hypothetical protein GGI03_005039 [Coemansia sp. RSA 2337]|nr:hypothetical protein GGI14_000458 [Coemansia sp. S680]KAJ2049499.1 hypothetical protein GGI08_005727 [Coemansia sp. S2]KAJ2098119.1 hypothetical protein IW146_010044 [Coemansia sp. RSA 922]KAJ2418170.1 hypothetical protein GGF41_005158 [Coemansia sp. RSA 2531]KAJ2461419.1 hypothetical protein GGI03_005039 [Coemansia sp. RSA 2337]